ncbi:hypothetical protein LK996_06395 [Lysobacter sp. A6]|uniref:Uncharacterized protein n=1 Tax=Noviluteimonas lactosilytica TaxID=2888523 RepID=A0ABS8JGH0_9GAMM|nr:hypothetical protein [Lysobacter lactosilyticus]MCC8362703.1 hypothetical protein [Lysobacter lactosilyticus]
MQYLVLAAVGGLAEPVSDRLWSMDPAALVDVDTDGRLRISTVLPDAEVLLALGLAGACVAPQDLERQPSDCCGGCGG